MWLGNGIFDAEDMASSSCILDTASYGSEAELSLVN